MTLFGKYVVAVFGRMLAGVTMHMHRQDRNIAHGAHDAGVTSRIPPAWAPEMERTYSFAQYIGDIMIWAAATDIDEARIAPTVALRLQGSAKLVVREMDPNMLINGVLLPNADPMLPAVPITGLQYVMRQLRRRYAPLEQETQIQSISDLFHFRKFSSETTDELIARFELCIHRAANQGQVVIGEAIQAWMLLSALGIPREKWALLLAPTVGALPQNAQQYIDFVSYMRRQGHMYDGARDKSIQQPYYGQTVHQYHQSYTDDSESTWPYPESQDSWQYAAFPAAPSESESWELSSGQSFDDEPVDLTDLAGLSTAEAGERVYMGYRTHKRRFRKFTKHPGRSHKFGKGRGKRAHTFKGKGKGKGKPAFWTAEGIPLYADDGFSTYGQEESWYGVDIAPAYAFQKGAGKASGKRRGNPIGPDGKVMKCILCGSEDHFQRFCSQNKGKGSGGSGKGSAASSSGYTGVSSAAHWTKQDEMPGTSTYYASLQDFPEEFSPAIQYPDGQFETLQTTTAMSMFADPGTPISVNPTTPQTIPSHLQKLWAFPWWTSVYHSTVRLPNGKEGLLIDCGAIDHMAGSNTVKRMAKAASAAGQGTAYSDINPISVEGVGEGASSASVQVSVPLCLADGQQGEYKAIVVGTAAKESDLPALYGMVGLRKQAAVIDCGNNRMFFPGPGGIKYVLSPGTKVHKLEVAASGHLMLPCCEWQQAKSTSSHGSATLL